ncbi:hypothetical protein CIPAW_11G189600 [Carya illinoinensis]|uniref:Uncharacterized protein n=1 Tax=Carya illinoinensis TaxID=32201 RepID=A0A8T1P730_CARIL|nr:hypothetical protein CIPAW_11G189600 [Carya illinoinensis]
MEFRNPKRQLFFPFFSLHILRSAILSNPLTTFVKSISSTTAGSILLSRKKKARVQQISCKSTIIACSHKIGNWVRAFLRAWVDAASCPSVI